MGKKEIETLGVVVHRGPRRLQTPKITAPIDRVAVGASTIKALGLAFSAETRVGFEPTCAPFQLSHLTARSPGLDNPACTTAIWSSYV
jgi:hypothetical protein